MKPCASPRAAADEPVSQAAFREAMSRLGAAVNIVTTDGPGGKAGFAATAVCSVTDTPPTLLVCINRSSSVVAAFSRNAHLCINTLSAAHRRLSGLFGGKTPVEERFAAASWRKGVGGVPVLEDGLVTFECAIANSVDVGTHTVLFCTVLAIAGKGTAGALIYFDRKYHTPSELG
ncbi:MAG: flavin reductase [Rhizobium sp.]